MDEALQIRAMRRDEATAFGQLLVEVYSALDGFPAPAEQPAYYAMLADVGRFADQPGVRVLVALTPQQDLAGGVVYFGNMAEYGAAGIATSLRDTSGIRLLAVGPRHRGCGAGKALTLACIGLARQAGHAQVVLHTTKAMQAAWRMYEALGFVRAEELDFQQQGFPVFGFRLSLRGA